MNKCRLVFDDGSIREVETTGKTLVKVQFVKTEFEFDGVAYDSLGEAMARKNEAVEESEVIKPAEIVPDGIKEKEQIESEIVVFE